MPILYRLNTKTRLTMLCLSGFELSSRWVPLINDGQSIPNASAVLAYLREN